LDVMLALCSKDSVSTFSEGKEMVSDDTKQSKIEKSPSIHNELKERFLRAARRATAFPPRKKTLSQIMASYLPKLVHLRLPRLLQREPLCDTLNGVVLFAG
jgi:hypothetical protein